MKKLILVLAIPLLLPAFASGHPCQTASDGRHTCRNNCDKWGAPWGKRHYLSRESEPIPISKINIDDWEYGPKIQNTGTRILNGKELIRTIN